MRRLIREAMIEIGTKVSHAGLTTSICQFSNFYQTKTKKDWRKTGLEPGVGVQKLTSSRLVSSRALTKNASNPIFFGIFLIIKLDIGRWMLSTLREIAGTVTCEYYKVNDYSATSTCLWKSLKRCKWKSQAQSTPRNLFITF